MKTDPAWTSVDAAAALLPEFSRKFFAAGREAFDKGDSESLHEFRIAAKKFRYALELFQPFYGPRFAQKLVRLKKLQDYLGHLNDLATVRIVVRGYESGAFLAWVDSEEADLRAKLTDFWKNTMDAPGAEENWTRYLVRYAGRTAKTAS